jgi:hypothetical protein
MDRSSGTSRSKPSYCVRGDAILVTATTLCGSISRFGSCWGTNSAFAR